MVLDGPCEDATSTPTVRSIYRVAECSEIPPVGIAASSPLSPGTTDAVGTATERHRTDGGHPRRANHLCKGMNNWFQVPLRCPTRVPSHVHGPVGPRV